MQCHDRRRFLASASDTVAFPPNERILRCPDPETGGLSSVASLRDLASPVLSVGCLLTSPGCRRCRELRNEAKANSSKGSGPPPTAEKREERSRLEGSTCRFQWCTPRAHFTCTRRAGTTPRHGVTYSVAAASILVEQVSMVFPMG